jgi:hypothetical protein
MSVGHALRKRAVVAILFLGAYEIPGLARRAG